MSGDWFALTWKVLVARGVAGVVLGVVALTWPGETAAAFVVLFGLWALLDGVGTLLEAFCAGPRGPRWLLLLMGAVSLVVGILAVTSPAMTATAVTWLLGIWLVVRGVAELAMAAFRPGARIALVGSGVVDVVLGVLFMANPGRAAVGIAWLLGLVAVVWGLAYLGAGIVVRSQVRKGADGGPDSAHAAAAKHRATD